MSKQKPRASDPATDVLTRLVNTKDAHGVLVLEYMRQVREFLREAGRAEKLGFILSIANTLPSLTWWPERVRRPVEDFVSAAWMDDTMLASTVYYLVTTHGDKPWGAPSLTKACGHIFGAMALLNEVDLAIHGLSRTPPKADNAQEKTPDNSTPSETPARPQVVSGGVLD